MFGGKLTAALSVLLLADSCSAISVANARERADFINAMREAMDEREFMEERAKLRKLKKEKFHRNLLSKAKPMPPSLKKQPVAKEPEFMNYAKAGTPSQVTPNRKLEDGDGDEDVDWGAFGFDVSEYSVKYTGCSAISMYNDEANGDDGDSVVETTRFVTFRLCNSLYCDSSSDLGCDSDYGDFILELGDYLTYFAEFENEMMEQFCHYCKQCIYFDTYFYGHRDLEDADADADVDAAAAEYFADDDAAADGDHACKFYDQCKSYPSVCYEVLEDDDYFVNMYAETYAAEYAATYGAVDDQYERIQYEDFFECINYGNYYLGPYCSGGEAISIGIFSDEMCTVYVGDSVDMNAYTGLDFDTYALQNFYSRKCLACKESDLDYNLIDMDAEDEDDINELCENLYVDSAKCLVNMEAEMAAYGGYNQQANEDKVCTFIENVEAGSYDEAGYININQGGESIFAYVYGDTSLVQVFSLVAGGFALAVMITWSCLLHKALRNVRSGGWKPPVQSPMSASPEKARDIEISRSNSGIMFARSEHEGEGVKTEGDEYTGGVMS
mmetsp:Transcript_41783/g.61156  ORF Transcript_41783/g.61156 Transcript_41783/m.61156 type:complete len:556 (-) Transcript_41783:207-1874(-)